MTGGLRFSRHNQPPYRQFTVFAPVTSHQFSQTDAALTIITLGTLRCVTDPNDSSAPGIIAGKPLALLVYLTACPGRTATREHLIDLLWADLERDAGRHALRQAVWFLRQRISDGAITATRGWVRLDAAIRTDREDFVQAVERQDCENAVATYAGAFLPNLALPGALEFEHWADVERQRLRAMFMRCGEVVVHRWLASARHREAIELARRVRDADQSSESGWRLHIEALMSANNYLAAATEADAFVKFLASEEREPDAATSAIIRAATSAPNHPVASAKPRVLSAELIGRAEEFATLVAAWDDARAGRIQHLHISAAAGVGKSRLLTDFAARLRVRRARVAPVSLRLGDRSIPYAALGQIVLALSRLPGAAAISPGAARAIVALHPTLSSTYAAESDTVQGDEAMRRRALAVHELIGAVSDEAPLALVVDDLHWMDDASSRALNSVLQRLEGQRVLVLTTSRPRYALPRSGSTTQLILRPFTATQVSALVASLGALPHEEWAHGFTEMLHAATDGVPLLLLETLHLLVERGSLHLAGSAWMSPQPAEVTRVLAAGSALRNRVIELTDDERRILTVLAAAGVSVSISVLESATELAGPEAAILTGQLEERGFIVPSGDGWELAHDVIGETALTIVTPDETRDAHRALADAYVARHATDASMLLRASRHFAQAGDADGVKATFVRWLGFARRVGDPRSVRDLAAEFAAGDEPLVSDATLRRAAPFHLRFSRRHLLGAVASALAAAATVVIAATAIIGFRARATAAPPPPDATLLAFYVDSIGDTVRTELDLRQSDNADGPIIVRSGRRSDVALPAIPFGITVKPGGKEWISQGIFPDSGGWEIISTDLRTGALRRLTHAPSDDVGPSWSPDGRFVVFATGRFDPQNHNDIAILEAQTGVTRRLTIGPDIDGGPVMHPSGSLVGFMRHVWATATTQLCTIGVDGSHEQCWPIEGATRFDLVGWLEDDRLLLMTGSYPETGPLTGLVTVDVRTRELRRLDSHVGRDCRASPNGKWMACQRQSTTLAPWRWVVFPLGQPELAREVIRDRLRDLPLELLWVGPARNAKVIADVRTDNVRGAIPLTTGFQMRAVAVDAAGNPASAPRIDWSSRDPDVAAIDSTGYVTPQRVGSARIRVSVGGLVSREVTVRVAAATATSILREDWRGGLEPQFVPFGEPRPRIVRDPALGHAMFNNGDGSFPSGVYSKTERQAARGMGVDIVVKTPITELQWQVLMVGFFQAGDGSQLTTWDHRTGAHPALSGPRRSCQFAMPAGEGPKGLRRVTVNGLEPSAIPVEDRFFRGEPFKVRVQLFPDGRCGVAIDGRALRIVPTEITGVDSYRLIIGGKSVHTQLLVGALEMWEGVKPDIDWRKANAP